MTVAHKEGNQAAVDTADISDRQAYYRRLGRQPGISTVPAGERTALEEIIPASRGRADGEARHRIYPGTGEDDWRFRPARPGLPTGWEHAGRRDLHLRGPVTLVLFGSDGHLIRRAIAARYRVWRASDTTPEQPPGRAEVAEHDGRRYVVLGDAGGIRAVYQVQDTGRLRGVKNWPDGLSQPAAAQPREAVR